MLLLSVGNISWFRKLMMQGASRQLRAARVKIMKVLVDLTVSERGKS
jgi:hypothetical protein